MTEFGYTMMTGQSRPDQLVRDVRSAEEAGFGFFTKIALVQTGPDQQKPFFEWAEKELLPALRSL